MFPGIVYNKKISDAIAYRYKVISKKGFSYDRKRNKYKITKDDDDTIISLREGGKSYEEITCVFGVSYWTISDRYIAIKKNIRRNETNTDVLLKKIDESDSRVLYHATCMHPEKLVDFVIKPTSELSLSELSRQTLS